MKSPGPGRRRLGKSLLRPLLRVLAGLGHLGLRHCALCTTRPVTRPGAPAHTIDGRFCLDCIDGCLAHTARHHWCPIDTLGHHYDNHQE